MSTSDDDPRARGEPPAEMATLYLGFLKKGANWSAEVNEQIKEDQRGHLANFAVLAEQGKLLIAGPTPDSEELRGIIVLKANTQKEARALMAEDPHLNSGRLILELHEWMVDADALRKPLVSTPNNETGQT